MHRSQVVAMAAALLAAFAGAWPSPAGAATAPLVLTIVSTSSWSEAGRVPLLHLVGELRNVDPTLSASTIIVDCKLLSGGATVQEELAPAEAAVLLPGERSPFEVPFVSPPSHDSTSCSALAAGSVLQPDHHFQAQLTSVGAPDPRTGVQEIDGTVSNLDPTPVGRAQIYFTFYRNATDIPRQTIAEDALLLNQGDQLPPNVPIAFALLRAGPSWDGAADALLVEAPRPAVSLSPATTAVTQLITTSSASQPVLFVNVGTDDLHIGALAIAGDHPGDWSEVDTCAGQTLLSLGSCTVGVTFTPTATGARNASLTVADDALNSPQAVSLLGTGINPLAIPDPSPLTFDPEVIGQTGQPRTLTVADPGVGALHPASAVIGGMNAGDFAVVSDGCSGTTVAQGSTCQLQLTFTAGGLGPRGGTITIADDALDSPQRVALSGKGVASSVTFDATSYVFGNELVGTTSAPLKVKIVNSGTSTLVVAGACLSNTTDFGAGPGGCAAGFSLAPGDFRLVPVTFMPATTGPHTTALSFRDNAAGSPHQVTLNGSGTFAGQYHAVSPTRLVDTRTGNKPLGGGHTVDVQIAGTGPVPGGATAAVLNVTVTNPTAPSYLTVYPTGALTPPTASNLNFVAGQTVPNLVEVALGVGGKVTVFNAAGSTDVVIDLEGYVTPPAASPGVEGFFNPLPPVRILDTRNGNGGFTTPLPGGHTMILQVAGRGGIPSSGAEAVVLNITVTNPSAASYLTLFPTGGAVPLASNLNFVAGQTVPNRVIVPLGGGAVSIYNAAGSVDVIADVAGSFTDTTAGGTGSGFTGVPPNRILDTRLGAGPVVAGVPRVLAVAGKAGDGVPAMTSTTPPSAVVLNVTVTNPTADGSFLTVWPDGTGQPLISDLNFKAGRTVPNLVVIKLGADGSIEIANAFGSADVVVDVVGWYS